MRRSSNIMGNPLDDAFDGIIPKISYKNFLKAPLIIWPILIIVIFAMYTFVYVAAEKKEVIVTQQAIDKGEPVNYLFSGNCYVVDEIYITPNEYGKLRTGDTLKGAYLRVGLTSHDYYSLEAHFAKMKWLVMLLPFIAIHIIAKILTKIFNLKKNRSMEDDD